MLVASLPASLRSRREQAVVELALRQQLATYAQNQPRMVPKLGRRLRGPLVVAKQTAKELMALDWPTATGAKAASTSIDQAIVEPLVIPLAGVVLDVLLDHSPKMAFTQRDHLSHTL